MSTFLDDDTMRRHVTIIAAYMDICDLCGVDFEVSAQDGIVKTHEKLREAVIIGKSHAECETKDSREFRNVGLYTYCGSDEELMKSSEHRIAVKEYMPGTARYIVKVLVLDTDPAKALMYFGRESFGKDWKEGVEKVYSKGM